MSYREIDCKRDQFRKYIESKGVIDSITKVLIKLLETPEKPEHPMDFIRANLGATQSEERRIESLEQEVDGYKKEVTDLKAQLEAVKLKLKEYEKSPDDKAADSDVKNDEKPSVQETDVKDAENRQTNDGATEVDANKDKNSTESEQATTPSSAAAPVDSAKAATDSENADTGKSNTSTAAKPDGEKANASSATTGTGTNTASDENDKSKASENASTATNPTENEK